MATTRTSVNSNEKYSGDDLEVGQQGAPLGRQITYTLSNEQFEKLYLSGGSRPKGDLTKRFGNPTMLGLISFLVALSTFSVELMGWGGVTSAASVTLSGGAYFVGGLGLFTAGLLEWVLGNTFPFTVFCSFGTFWMAFGFLIQPSQMIAAAVRGASTLDYNLGVAFYLICWAFLVLLYMIAALKTNVVFFLLFFCLEINFWFLITAYVKIGGGVTSGSTILTLFKVSGAFGFMTSVCGWYLLIVTLFATIEFPISLPVGDLSSNFTTRRAIGSEPVEKKA